MLKLSFQGKIECHQIHNVLDSLIGNNNQSPYFAIEFLNIL